MINSVKWSSLNSYLKSVAIGMVALFSVLIVSSSVVIALTFAVLVAVITFIATKRKNDKRSEAMSAAWPEVIDHLVTGIQSGLSITESLTGLSIRGPEVLRPLFADFAESMRLRGNFDVSLSKLKKDCSQTGSDQIFEAVSISKTLGGAELLSVLRTVGTFLRQDLALRREIDVKHGWIKNSAHLSAAAPWILLLLLSTQPATSSSFSTRSGVLILLFGMAMTAVAYLWMNHLSKLPELPRVFGDR